LVRGEYAGADETLSGISPALAAAPETRVAHCRAMIGMGRFTSPMQQLSVVIRELGAMPSGTSPVDIDAVRLRLGELRMAWGAPGLGLATLDGIDPESQWGPDSDAVRATILLTLGSAEFDRSLLGIPDDAPQRALFAATEAALAAGEVDEAERLFGVWRSNLGQSGLLELMSVGVEVELLVRRDRLDDAEALLRARGPEIRVGVMNRLTWLCVRAENRNDFEILARALALQRMLQPRSPELAVRAAWLGYRQGEREESLALLDAQLEYGFD